MARLVVDDVLHLKVPVYTAEEQQKVATEFEAAVAGVEGVKQKLMPLYRELRSAYGSVRSPEDPSGDEEPASGDEEPAIGHDQAT